MHASVYGRELSNRTRRIGIGGFLVVDVFGEASICDDEEDDGDEVV